MNHNHKGQVVIIPMSPFILLFTRFTLNDSMNCAISSTMNWSQRLYCLPGIAAIGKTLYVIDGKDWHFALYLDYRVPYGIIDSK